MAKINVTNENDFTSKVNTIRHFDWTESYFVSENFGKSSFYRNIGISKTKQNFGQMKSARTLQTHVRLMVWDGIGSFRRREFCLNRR